MAASGTALRPPRVLRDVVIASLVAALGVASWAAVVDGPMSAAPESSSRFQLEQFDGEVTGFNISYRREDVDSGVIGFCKETGCAYDGHAPIRIRYAVAPSPREAWDDYHDYRDSVVNLIDRHPRGMPIPGGGRRMTEAFSLADVSSVHFCVRETGAGSTCLTVVGDVVVSVDSYPALLQPDRRSHLRPLFVAAVEHLDELGYR
jgi:hypothetical protein